MTFFSPWLKYILWFWKVISGSDSPHFSTWLHSGYALCVTMADSNDDLWFCFSYKAAATGCSSYRWYSPKTWWSVASLSDEQIEPYRTTQKMFPNPYFHSYTDAVSHVAYFHTHTAWVCENEHVHPTWALKQPKSYKVWVNGHLSPSTAAIFVSWNANISFLG